MTMQDKIYVKAMEFIKDMKYEEDYIKELAKTTTDPEIFNELSKDGDCEVRCNVAENPNTSPKTLDYLSKDKCYGVLWEVADNPNASPETLVYLSKDKDWAIRDKAKSNPNYPNIFKRIKMIFNRTKNTPEYNDNWIQDFENSIINSLTEEAKLVYEIHK